MAAPAHAELDFRRLLEALPAAAYVCDPEGHITAYNSRAVQAWGREPRLNGPQDRYCGSFRMHTPDGAPVPHSECWMARCLKEGKEYNGEEIVVERPDGSRLVVLAHAIPLYGDDGKLTGAVSVVVDITGRKRTEQQLQESERQLIESVRRKDAFLATLAHELRNPLAPIRNALRMLRLAQDGNRELAPVHQMLERQVDHLVRLVDGLLNVSRITRDQIELQREPVIAARHVLVVDDNRDAAHSLGALLTILGVAVTVVHDGSAALEALKAVRPSAALLDIGMPEMDGYELARRMRQEPEGRGLTLIAVTGWGQDEDRERSKAAGIDHHLIKPVDGNALIELLAAVPSDQPREPEASQKM